MRLLLAMTLLLAALPALADGSRASRGLQRRGVQSHGLQNRAHRQRGFQQRGIARRSIQGRSRRLAPGRRRRLGWRRGLSNGTPGSGQGSGAASGQQGYQPPGVHYDAPTFGTKTEQPGSGQWQPGFGSISGDRMAPLGGAGLGGAAPAQNPAPGAGATGSSAAGGNAITPNN